MLDFFRSLLPKEDAFFDLFERHSKLVSSAAGSLKAGLSTAADGTPGSEAHLADVVTRENDADAVTREVKIAVRRSFITPFDRTSILALIEALDDAIDQMQKTCKTISVYRITAFPPEMVEMADRIVEAATLVEATLPLLRSVGSASTEIADKAQRMSRIEGRADDVYDRARLALFDRATGPDARMDPVSFWASVQMMDSLEKVVDKLEDAMNEISSVAIDNA